MNKKILAIATVLVLAVNGLAIYYIGGDDNTDIFRFVFDDPIISNIELEDKLYTCVKLGDNYNNGEPGKPYLPMFNINLLLPRNRNVSNIEIIPIKQKTYYLDLPVVPTQNQYPLCWNGTTEFIIDNCTYNSTENIFEEQYIKGIINYNKGYPLLDITIRPFNYLPKDNILTFYQEFDMKITYIKDNTTTNNLYRGFDAEEIKEDIYNKETFQTYNDMPLDTPIEYTGGICDPNDDYKWVAIVNETMISSWQPLLQHRQQYSGLTAKLVTVAEILAEPTYYNTDPIFNDSAARVREFCKDAYQDWGTEYLLLGGDGLIYNYTTQTWNDIVPYREFDTLVSYTYHTMPCDLYFSNLDDDWYHNGVWGGGSNAPKDLYSEINVGRICVSTPDHVSNAINKIIEYETSQYNNEWYQTCGFIGGNLGWASTSKQYMEELRTGTGCFSEYEGFEEFKVDHPEYPLNTTWNRYYHADYTNWATLTDLAIKADNFSILNHLGHSSPNTPFSMPSWGWRFNTQPFFGWSQGCLAGRFPGYTSGSEQLQCSKNESHAYGVVFNTGYGWGSTGSTCGKSQQQQKIFWHYFFDVVDDNPEEWILGDAHTYQKDTYGAIAQYSSIGCYAWYSSHYFGDPATRLKLEKDNSSEIQLTPGHNYLTYTGPDTTLMDIASDIPLDDGEAVLIQENNVWYAWIKGFSTPDFNKNVTSGDYIDIVVDDSKTWVI